MVGILAFKPFSTWSSENINKLTFVTELKIILIREPTLEIVSIPVKILRKAYQLYRV